MAHEDKKSLIFHMYEMAMGAKAEKKEQSRFNNSTNSLYSNGMPIKDGVCKQENTSCRHLIPLEKKDFNLIMNGNMTFWICCDDSFMLKDTVTFKEFDNLKETGRITVKEITHIVKGTENSRIQAGYCVIGWR